MTLLLNNLSESARERPVDVSYFEDDELSLAIMLGGTSSSGGASGHRNAKRSADWINRIETQDEDLGANYTIYNVGVLMASHLGMFPLCVGMVCVGFASLWSVMSLINTCFNYYSLQWPKGNQIFVHVHLQIRHLIWNDVGQP